MISLIFIVLEQLPVISNGHRKQLTSKDKLHSQLEKPIPKTYQDLSNINQIDFNGSTFPFSSHDEIDRKSLPEISFSAQNKEKTYVAPTTELKKTIANVWQELIYTDRLDSPYNNLKSNGLKQVPLFEDETASSNLSQSDANGFSDISTTTNFHSLGGNSLQLVQIYRHYQSLFNFDSEAITIRPFFECNTIDEHAKLLETIIKDDTESKQWHTLHINNGKTLFNLFLE
jgi:hypothetical protein